MKQGTLFDQLPDEYPYFLKARRVGFGSNCYTFHAVFSDSYRIEVFHKVNSYWKDTIINICRVKKHEQRETKQILEFDRKINLIDEAEFEASTGLKVDSLTPLLSGTDSVAEEIFNRNNESR